MNYCYKKILIVYSLKNPFSFKMLIKMYLKIYLKILNVILLHHLLVVVVVVDFAVLAKPVSVLSYTL